eukprot:gb/GECG01013390.1/.p1 GENE.gb/GECG01013390.1/~~gb/GECG01013390.1/.p1  ORF type:complete len:213 (+),score=15.40 gb/GECG01013390.1/:1-639(+)
MYNDVHASQVFASQDAHQTAKSFLEATLRESVGLDGRTRKQRVPTVIRDAGKYIFHSQFLEEGVFGQFLHGNSAETSRKVYVACSESSQDNSRSSQRESTFYGDHNQSVIEMPFRNFLEHYCQCTGMMSSGAAHDFSYLNTGLSLYLMQSCIRSSNRVPQDVNSSDILLPELADYVQVYVSVPNVEVYGISQRGGCVVIAVLRSWIRRDLHW